MLKNIFARIKTWYRKNKRFIGKFIWGFTIGFFVSAVINFIGAVLLYTTQFILEEVEE